MLAFLSLINMCKSVYLYMCVPSKCLKPYTYFLNMMPMTCNAVLLLFVFINCHASDQPAASAGPPSRAASLLASSPSPPASHPRLAASSGPGSPGGPPADAFNLIAVLIAYVFVFVIVCGGAVDTVRCCRRSSLSSS